LKILTQKPHLSPNVGIPIPSMAKMGVNFDTIEKETGIELLSMYVE
jgi:hypothetical protein